MSAVTTTSLENSLKRPMLTVVKESAKKRQSKEPKKDQKHASAVGVLSDKQIALAFFSNTEGTEWFVILVWRMLILMFRERLS